MTDNEQNDFTIRTMEGDVKGAPAEVMPTTVNQLPGGAIVEEPSVKRKKILIIAAIVAGALILGSVGYFAVYPLVFPPKAEAPIAEQPVPASPVVESHQSLFVKLPLATARVNLPGLMLLNIAVALQNEAAKPLANKSVKEVEILDGQGSQIPFGSYLAQFLPVLPTDKLAEWFVNDFTAYLYYDENGVWPGYAAKINTAADMEEIEAGLGLLESSDLTVFYLTAPGVFGNFRDGMAFRHPTRYSVASQKGAAFNYALINDRLLLSTSYDGLRAAIQLLGLENAP